MIPDDDPDMDLRINLIRNSIDNKARDMAEQKALLLSGKGDGDGGGGALLSPRRRSNGQGVEGLKLEDGSCDLTFDRRQYCPDIVSFYGAYTEPNKGKLHLVMEYMDLGSLHEGK